MLEHSNVFCFTVTFTCLWSLISLFGRNPTFDLGTNTVTGKFLVNNQTFFNQSLFRSIFVSAHPDKVR